MNYRIIYSCLILFVVLSVKVGFSQQIDPSADGYNIPLMPRIMAASPEASSLGKYGGVPVDLAKGQLSYSIPLYTIKTNGFEFPLTLSYNYSGFKPDTDPTMVGMGWTANFSGAIIRQLKGTNDEDPSNGYFFHANHYDYENLESLPVADQVIALSNATDNGVDTRPDRFFINTSSISGNFRFNKNKVAVFSENKNYKVILPYFPNFYQIDVKDDTGVLYEFNTSELTQTMDWDNASSSNWPAIENFDYTSAWILDNIKLPQSDKEISFQYDDYTSSHVYLTRSKTIRSENFSTSQVGNTNHFSSDDIHSKIIKRIDFPEGYVLFDQNIYTKITPHPELNSSSATTEVTEQVKLQALRVYDLNDVLIEKYVFDYYDTGYYFFLKSIKKEDINGVQTDYYDFDYLNLSQMPATRIINNKMDMWGFYNGVSFNEQNLTNSLKASFNYGKIGALSKITYPTKGTTDIEYESNTVRRTGSFYDSSYPVYNAYETLFYTATDANFDCNFQEKLITIPFSQQVEVTLEVDVTADNAWASASLQYSNGGYVHYTNGVSSLNVELIGSEENIPANQDHHLTQVLNITLSAGTYKMVADLCDGYAEPQNARVSIRYRTIPYFSDPYVYNIDVGGVRVAQTRDCPNDGTLDGCVTKQYKYTTGDLGNTTSGFLVELYPRFKSITLDGEDFHINGSVLALPDGNIVFVASSVFDHSTYSLKTEYYRPLTPLTVLGSHVLYTRVETIPVGGIEEDSYKTVNYYYFFGPDYITPDNPVRMDEFPDLHVDTDYKEMKAFKQEVKTIDGTTTKELTNNYYQDITYDSALYSNDFQACRVFVKTFFPYSYGVLQSGIAKSSMPDEFLTNSRKHRAKKYNLINSSTNYTLSNGVINKNVFYDYDEDTGYLRAIRSVDSDNGEQVKQMYYPNNKSLVTDLSSAEEQALDELVTKNIVASPFQVEEYNTTDPDNSKNTRRTTYKDWGSNLIFPEYVKTSKGINSLENRIKYNQFDAKGNPLEVQQESGMVVTYLWGYNQTRPIAKIENATYSQVQPYESNLQTLSNGTDENALLAALNSLRTALPNAMVTTYTYKPLVGVSTITDPKGNKMTYHYDSFNRLQYIKDKDGNILSENEYHYKN